MRPLSRQLRIAAFVVLVLAITAAGWLFWNRPVAADMAAYVPSDCLAFVESNNLTILMDQISNTNAWKALSGPIGAKTTVTPNRWAIRLARWTGLAPAAAVVFARSQVAVIFTDAQTNQTGDAIIIKPVAALVVEAHTSQARMRPVMEKAIENFAGEIFGPPLRTEKQIGGLTVLTWSSQDGSRHLSMTFEGTAVVISNDEALLVRCVNVRRGLSPSLAGNRQVALMREKVNAAEASVFGMVPNAGIKPLLQAWLMSQTHTSEDSFTAVRLFGDTFGNLVDALAWSSKFADGSTEDRCFALLTQGVANQIRSNLIPDTKIDEKLRTLIPSDTYSVSLYHVQDASGFWQDLNATVSSHAEPLAAIMSRPFIRSLVRPYGIGEEDADRFARAVGPQFATVRLDPTSRAVLIAQAFDRQVLHKIALQHLGANARTETVGDAELMLSGSDDWAAAFADNYFLSGPADAVRNSLLARAESRSLTSVERFKRAQTMIDIGLPINLTKFTDDRQAAITFVELFSQSERPTFSSRGESVDNASRSLPYAVSVTILKDNGFDWTSRSAFGLMGSLFVYLAPEKVR